MTQQMHATMLKIAQDRKASFRLIADSFRMLSTDAETPHKGAGVMFVAPDGRCLFLKRSGSETRSGMWCWPGGTPEDGETPEETAKRETKEETDYDIERDLVPVDHRDGFLTFGVAVPKQFTANLSNGEHSEFMWAHPENPPQPLHPGVAATLADKKAMGAWRGLYGNAETMLTGDALAQDKSARSIDGDGHMIVRGCLLTKAVVNPYKGEEIPEWQSLGLERDKIYQLYRDPGELKKAVPSLEGKPLLIEHRPTTSDDHQARVVGGSVFNPQWNEAEKAIYGDLSVWPQDAIDDIEDDRKRDLSCGYRYTPVMEAGTAPDGSKFDGRMTKIQMNHVALVTEGRVKGAMVADAALDGWAALGEALDAFSFANIASAIRRL